MTETVLNTKDKEKRTDPFALARKCLPRKLYISDLHFYHGSLNRSMDCRGFEDEYKMNEYMIKQWNEHVGEHDEVYILGDFCIGLGEMTADILRSLTGKKYLIVGNHDHYLTDKRFDQSLFEWVRPYAEIRDKKRDVVLSHYPVFCYNGQYHTDREGKPNTYMLYGHVHDSFDERLVNEFIMKTRSSKRLLKKQGELYIPCQMINCFCMYSDYVPLSLDEWIILDEKRRKEMTDV